MATKEVRHAARYGLRMLQVQKMGNAINDTFFTLQQSRA
jgi:hypothetical protein